MILDKAHTLKRMESAAKAIFAHTEECKTCPPFDMFGTIIVPLGACGAGRSLWKTYLRATVDYAAARS